jgi:hypothetical protein
VPVVIKRILCCKFFVLKTTDRGRHAGGHSTEEPRGVVSRKQPTLDTQSDVGRTNDEEPNDLLCRSLASGINDDNYLCYCADTGKVTDDQSQRRTCQKERPKTAEKMIHALIDAADCQNAEGINERLLDSTAQLT